MTNQLTAIFIRLFAIFIIVFFGLRQAYLISSVMLDKGFDFSYGEIIVLMAATVPILLGILMLLLPNTFARALLPKLVLMPESSSQTFRINIPLIVFSFGVYYSLNGFFDSIYWISLSIKENFFFNYNIMPSDVWAGLVSSIIESGIGLMLIFRCKSLINK
jgi:hypothetical protein